MSMFERLGEKVERFKQEAVSARDESVKYRCRNCDEGLYSEQETCPECGSADIDQVRADTDTDTDVEAASDKTAPGMEGDTDDAKAESDE